MIINNIHITPNIQTYINSQFDLVPSNVSRCQYKCTYCYNDKFEGRAKIKIVQ
jgi:sulfatase maturation enzyme AslB (radical SAM superfamily)